MWDVRSCVAAILVTLMLAVFWLAVLGMVLTVVWMHIKKKWIEDSEAVFIYTSLRVILLLFAVPVVYGIRLWYNMNFSHATGLGDYTGHIFDILEGMCVIWVLGVLRFTWRYMYKKWLFAKILSQKCPVDKPTAEVFRNVCRELRIRRKIRLYEIPGIESPFITGVLRPKICIPMRRYAENEMRMILIHEGIHYKQKDMLWKTVVCWLQIFLWFCPVLRNLSREVQIWCEHSCDSRCCRIYDARQYFRTLLEMADRSEGNNCAFASYLSEAENGLKQRVCYIKRERKFREYAGRRIALSTCMLLAGIVLGTVAVDAAVNSLSSVAYEATATGEGEYDLTRYVEYESPALPEDEEYIEYADDSEMYEVPVSKSRIYTWNIDPQEQIMTEEIFLEAGQSIAAIVKNEELKREKLKVGILDPEGIEHFSINIEGIFDYKVRKTGKYKLFVKNQDKKSVKIDLDTGIYDDKSYIPDGMKW